MLAIPISDVAPGSLKPALDADAAVRSLLLKPVEGLHCAADRLVTCDTMHAFAKAAHDAFFDHHPLVIRPDDVWFCVVQGLAQHIAVNTEALRGRIVDHDGRKKLSVERPDFLLGQPNPWPEAFEAFSTQIGANVGPLRALAGLRFSTSTPTETAAFDVALMDAFQGYFEYEMRCGCGIPEVRLLGTADDWRAIRERLPLLASYDLAWWTEALDPVLARIGAAFDGDVDSDFWRSFFRYESGSGGAELTGWILTLFPYLNSFRSGPSLVPNEFIGNWRERLRAAEARGKTWLGWDNIQGPGLGRVPGSLASAPVRFVDVRDGSETALRFVAGMFGVEQSAEDGALAAVFGWAVVHDVQVEPPPRRDLISMEDFLAATKPAAGAIDEITGLPIKR